MKMETAFAQMENLDGRGRSALMDRWAEATVEEFLVAYDEGEVAETTGVGEKTMAQLEEYVPLLRAQIDQEGAEGSQATQGEGAADQPQADATGAPADDEGDAGGARADAQPTADEIQQQLEEDSQRAAEQAAAEKTQAEKAKVMYAVRLKQNAKYHAGAATVIFGGQTHVISKAAALIVRGEAMMETVAKACKAQGLGAGQLSVEPITEGELNTAPASRVVSSIDVARAGR